ncbi:hypothetical protein DYU05_16910 [Mucilaginibacter terrenus]|uniref:Uncharacterized protein n=1 Tax=Mucilaginibacter terrenus TaxID=2482727 RepID=A0A3E2NMS0_9SPHI|nr:hypothetical protein [Mucilaginibacter terrenus]RFZ82294.1 hypothetical protein DYU05_16910 [Mucilaginibacter terrenus]
MPVIHFTSGGMLYRKQNVAIMGSKIPKKKLAIVAIRKRVFELDFTLFIDHAICMAGATKSKINVIAPIAFS